MDVTGEHEHDADGAGSQRPIQWHHGMRGIPGKKGSGRLIGEIAAGGGEGRGQRPEAEPGKSNRMTRRDLERPEHLSKQNFGIPNERAEEAPVGGSIDPKPGGGGLV